jgi:hypothetical protein
MFLRALALAPVAVLAGCGGSGGEAAPQPEVAQNKLRVRKEIKEKGDAALKGKGAR